MSNVKKSRNVLLDISGGGYFLTPGRVVSVKELERNKRLAMVDERIRAQTDILDANAALNKILARSNQIINTARAESAQAIKNAKKQGFEKGYKDGYNIGYAEHASKAIEEKQPLLDNLSQLSQRYSECCKMPESSEYLDSAFELAEAIIKMELKNNSDAFFGLYKKAAMHVSNVSTATLKAGPKEIAEVDADKEKFESAIEGLSELKTAVIGDDDGTCILETPLGNIDTSVSAQLKRAKNVIMPHR
jgi:flagellar assembly protein FliH